MSGRQIDPLSAATAGRGARLCKTSLRLAPQVKDALRLAAAAERVSMNEWMVRAIRRRVEAAEAAQALRLSTDR